MSSEQSKVLIHSCTILDCFSPNKPELGVREAARMTGLSSSTTGRLMSSMKELGMLSQNPVTRMYSLGSRILGWSGVYLSSIDMRNVALPLMSELHGLTQETISLYMLDGNDRLCIERMESPQNVRIIARVGRRLPLYAGSAGKVILAFLPENRLEQILSTTEFNPFTPRTIISREDLLKELVRIREKGYAVSHGEWIMDAAGVAAPVLGIGGEVLGALTISGPRQRFNQVTVDKYAVEVVRVAMQISTQMGFSAVNLYPLLEKES